MHSWCIGWSVQLRKRSAWVWIQSKPLLSGNAVHLQPVKWLFLEDNPTGSRVPMVFNYSCCVVLGSGLVRNCLNYPATSESKGCNGIMAIDLAHGARLDTSVSCQLKTKTKTKSDKKSTQSFWCLCFVLPFCLITKSCNY